MFKSQSASSKFLMSVNKKHTSKVTMEKKPPTAKGPVNRVASQRTELGKVKVK